MPKITLAGRHGNLQLGNRIRIAETSLPAKQRLVSGLQLWLNARTVSIGDRTGEVIKEDSGHIRWQRIKRLLITAVRGYLSEVGPFLGLNRLHH